MKVHVPSTARSIRNGRGVPRSTSNDDGQNNAQINGDNNARNNSGHSSILSNEADSEAVTARRSAAMRVGRGRAESRGGATGLMHHQGARLVTGHAPHTARNIRNVRNVPRSASNDDHDEA